MPYTHCPLLTIIIACCLKVALHWRSWLGLRSTLGGAKFHRSSFPLPLQFTGRVRTKTSFPVHKKNNYKMKWRLASHDGLLLVAWLKQRYGDEDERTRSTQNERCRATERFISKKNQTGKTTPGTEDMRTSETVEQIILPHHLRIPKQKMGNNVTWYYDKQTPLSVSSPNFPFYCFHLRLSSGKGGQ